MGKVTYDIKIHRDHARFRQIVKGKVRENLKKYIVQGALPGKKGGRIVRVPIPGIELPRFKFGSRQMGGVGQGDGEVGDPIASDPTQGLGPGQAGNQPGQHGFDVELDVEEIADILGEELNLPRIKPKGSDQVNVKKWRYTGIARVGPESLRHVKRTFKRALKRQIASGEYDPKRPVIIPTSDDKRYKTWKIKPIPQFNAVIIYMMDVSGSMGDEQKEIVRTEAFWIDTWIRKHYENVKYRYIVHEAVAKEVDRETFFTIREGGGTMISTAYALAEKLIREEYPPQEWNIYLFHFSDGDNWAEEDTLKCVEILKRSLLPACNLFGYGQVKSAYGSGQFIKDLRKYIEDERLILSEINSKEDILNSLKDFLGKGK